MLEIIISFFKYLKIFQQFTKGGIYLSFFLTTIAGLSEGFGIILLLPIVNRLVEILKIMNQEYQDLFFYY